MSNALQNHPATERLGLRLAWQGVRPQTLPLALVPVVVGSALAWREGLAANWVVLLLTVMCAVLIQAGTNLFNDAADAEAGNDGPERAGPIRLTGSGLAEARAVNRAAWRVFLAALLIGLALAWKGGWPIMVIGLTGLAAGWAYSRGPVPLSYTPWGEVFVMVFFGIAAVLGSYLLQGGSDPAGTWVPGLALGLPAAAVLLINNYRDADADRAAGRRTLALVLGAQGSRWLNAFFLLVPFALLTWSPGPPLIMPCWLMLPIALWLSGRMFVISGGPALNRQMQGSVLLHGALGALLTIGLLTGGMEHSLNP